MADYKFYITPCVEYPTDSYKGELDIEARFGCKYQSFTGLGEDGDASNVYTEEYAEGEQVRVYEPDPSELVHSSTECKLTLLWCLKGDNFLNQALETVFQGFIFGRRIIWYDTFRQKYFILLMQKQPSVGEEKLYGGQQWRQVTYTFTNLAGKGYSTKPTVIGL